MFGYKQVNKKYLKMKMVEENLNKIQDNFTNPDIAVVTGFYNNYYRKLKNKKKNFRISQNQLYYSTGEIEQIKIGLDCVLNDRIVIMKEDCQINVDDIKKGIRRKTIFTLVGKDKRNPGVIIENNLVQNLSFGLNKNTFGDFLFFNKEDLLTIENFIYKESSGKKKFHELVEYLVNIKPMKFYWVN